jgi:hypothetical protein
MSKGMIVFWLGVVVFILGISNALFIHWWPIIIIQLILFVIQLVFAAHVLRRGATR